MKVVKVYGALRKKLGQCRFEFEADTPAQALKALCVNFQGLEKWLIDSEQEGVGYRVTVGKEKLTAENASPLVLPWSEREVFSITPVVVGAGGGGGIDQIFAGIGLVALAILAGPAGAGFLGLGAGIFSGATAAAVSTTLGLVGTSLILGGVAQLISPAPQNAMAMSMERGPEAAKLESFSFSGIVNTAKQGMACPVAYGRVVVGSAVISVGLDVDQG